MTDEPPHSPPTPTEQRDRVNDPTNIRLKEIQHLIKRFSENEETKVRNHQPHLRLPDADLVEIANKALNSISKTVLNHDPATLPRFARICVRNALFDHLRNKRVRNADTLEIQPIHEPETIAIASSDYDSFYETMASIYDRLETLDHKLLFACRVRYLVTVPDCTITEYVRRELGWEDGIQKARRESLETFWKKADPETYNIYYYRLFPKRNVGQNT